MAVAQPEFSPKDLLSLLPESEQREWLSKLSPQEIEDLKWNWRFNARPKTEEEA